MATTPQTISIAYGSPSVSLEPGVYKMKFKPTMRHGVIALLAVISGVVLWLGLPRFLLMLSDMIRGFRAEVDIVKGSALVVACAALVVAWNNFRRGNTAIVKLVSVSNSGGQRLDVNKREFYSQFEIKIKNLGIPLRNPSVALLGFTQLGSLSIPLQRLKEDQPVSNEGTLEKGMVARYAIRSFEMDSTDRSMVYELVDPDAVDISVSVYSEGYRVKEFCFPSKGVRLWLMCKWNRMAWAINEWFAYDIEKWGRKFTHRPDYIPTFAEPFRRLKRFVEGLSEAEKPNIKVPTKHGLFTTSDVTN
jgi:hypothetical protein